MIFRFLSVKRYVYWCRLCKVIAIKKVQQCLMHVVASSFSIRLRHIMRLFQFSFLDAYRIDIPKWSTGDVS